MRLEKLMENGLLFTPYNNGGSKVPLELCQQMIALICRRLDKKNSHIILTKKSLCELMNEYEDTCIYKRYKKMYVYSRLEEAYRILDVHGITDDNITDSFGASLRKSIYKLIDEINSYVSDVELSRKNKLEILGLQVYTCESMKELSEVLDLLCWINNIIKYISEKYK